MCYHGSQSIVSLPETEEPEIKKPTWGCPRGPRCLARSARGGGGGWGVVVTKYSTSSAQRGVGLGG